MNTDQLKKNVGQLLRLRPRPHCVDLDLWSSAVSLFPRPRRLRLDEDADFDWRLDEVTAKGVKLVCPATGHTVTLGADNVREYRSPNFLMLRCRLTLDAAKVHIEPI